MGFVQNIRNDCARSIKTQLIHTKY